MEEGRTVELYLGTVERGFSVGSNHLVEHLVEHLGGPPCRQVDRGLDKVRYPQGHSFTAEPVTERRLFRLALSREDSRWDPTTLSSTLSGPPAGRSTRCSTRCPTRSSTRSATRRAIRSHRGLWTDVGTYGSSASWVLLGYAANSAQPVYRIAINAMSSSCVCPS